MNLETAISTIAKCYVAPDQFDLKKVDYLTLSIACTISDTAMKNGLISEEEFKNRIKRF